MDLDDYQRFSTATAVYPRGDHELQGISYCVLGLNGEAGEVAELVKKLIRDGFSYSTDRKEVYRESIKKELGDVLWYLSQLATEHNFSLNEIAQWNLDKLNSRKERGVLGGSGNDR